MKHLYTPTPHTTLLCWSCGGVKDDAEFPRHVAHLPLRRYRSTTCRACLKAAKENPDARRKP